ncbi:HNH endonuclease signature motif containing protein [Rhizohabitans arisaemae]|uniref:HNH endonuclease signature motif containing protein n=1 Tax=Rhizohabitans arisaemae TaxID=2720610 RepID=UPI0024B10CAB|nr:HNH endonuclease signature motif containing protein [Rhizohabitans arisaemae]
MSVPVTQQVPAGLAQMPPGPELALVLSRIDEAAVSAADAVEVLKAWHRQRAHDEARFMAVTVEVGLRSPGPDSRVCRMEAPDEFSADELRPALAWSRGRASSRLSEAWDLMSRLPMVHAALERGVIDEVKARAFASWTRGLTVDQARSVCGRLLAVAGVLTVGELIEAIRRAALMIDPGWADRRYAAGVRERRVVGSRNPDGTANLSGLDQPLDRVAAACNRVDALARRAKAAGDRRLTRHVRSELFLGLLDGGFQGWTEEEIVAFLVGQSRAARMEAEGGAGPESAPLLGADSPSGGGGARRWPDAGGLDRPEPGGVSGAPARSDGLNASEVSGGVGGQGASGLNGFEAGTGDARGNRRAVVVGKGGSAGHDDAGGRDGSRSPAGARGTLDSQSGVTRGGRGSGPVESADRGTEPGDGTGVALVEPGGVHLDAGRGKHGGAELGIVARRDSLSGDGGERRHEGAGESAWLGEAGSSSMTEGVRSPGEVPRAEVPGDIATAGRQAGESGPATGGQSGSPQRWAAGELRVEVTTLLGLDEHPGELAGWGPISPGLARQIAHRQGDAIWRWVLTDEEGRLAGCGVTRHRPAAGGEGQSVPANGISADIARRIDDKSRQTLIGTSAASAGACTSEAVPVSGAERRTERPDAGSTALNSLDGGKRKETGAAVKGPADNAARSETKITNSVRARGIVEIQIAAADLPRLTGLPGLPDGWRKILGDIARRVSNRTNSPPGSQAPGNQDPKRGPTPKEPGKPPAAAHRLDDRPGTADPGDDLGRRLPGAALRRYVQVRDRVCTAPGCQVPASRTDQDHIREWGKDGPTVAANLHSVCRHDHRLRHEGGWRVAMTPAGAVVWITRLSQVCPVSPPPAVVPLPDPAPCRADPPDYPIRDDDTPTFTSFAAHRGSAAAGASWLTSADGVGVDDLEIPPF